MNKKIRIIFSSIQLEMNGCHKRISLTVVVRVRLAGLWLCWLNSFFGEVETVLKKRLANQFLVDV
jgi:hypothetical protein